MRRLKLMARRTALKIQKIYDSMSMMNVDIIVITAGFVGILIIPRRRSDNLWFKLTFRKKWLVRLIVPIFLVNGFLLWQAHSMKLNDAMNITIGFLLGITFALIGICIELALIRKEELKPNEGYIP